MVDWQKIRTKFICTGVDLKHPVDAMPPGKYPYLENVEAPDDEAVQSRDGLTTIMGSGALDQTLVHSLKRTNSNLPGAAHPFLRFAGAGTKLYAGVPDSNPALTDYTAIDTGYSGNPLSFVAFRPSQSPQPWLYIGDSNKLRKASMDGSTVYNMGIQPPAEAMTLDIAPPNQGTVTDFGSTPTWTATGNAGSVATGNPRVPPGTTITTILYDIGTTNGWACIQPSSATNNWVGNGALLTIGTEDVWIDQTFQVQPATTIAGILYDSGSTGLCTISATTTYASMMRNQLIFVGGHATRVLSVTVGPDGQYSFRCSLPATVAAGAAIVFVPSFRAYLTTTHAAGEAITGKTTTVQFTGGGAGAIHGADTLNLAAINGRQVHPQDYLHLSIRFDHPENVQEVRLWLDIDANGNNDFLHNSLMYAFRPSDAQAVMAGALTALTGAQTALQNYQIDAAGNLVLNSSVSGQMALGMQAWTELYINIAELQRNGTDPASSLATVAALQISAITIDTCVMEVSAWWVGGTFGPDINQQVNGPAENEILYRYKYRSSATGAESLPSPITRSGVLPKRGEVILVCPSSSDPQVDKIDIERIGGSLTEFHYVGTMENSSPRTADDLWDVAAEVLPPLNDRTTRPFPVTDQPRLGIVNTAGTRVVRVSGDLFNVNWQPGTQIKINGVAYTLYATPSSTGALETVENIGALTNATLEIPAATILGFPLPIIFGNGVTMFGVGDPYNPGRAYFCTGNDPDSCPGSNYVEVSSPSDPLVSGCCDVDGNAYVFTSSRPYLLVPGGANTWTPQAIASPSGLLSRWALASGAAIWFLGRDGIYEMPIGGTPALITKDDIEPLFPQNGIAPTSAQGQTVNGWRPPNFSSPATLQLNCGLRWVWFDYLDVFGDYRTIEFDLYKRGWFPQTYNPDAGAVITHYQEEGQGLNSVLVGSNTGRIYRPEGAGAGDNTTRFDSTVVVPALDGGDARMQKEWGDAWLAYSIAGGGVSVLEVQIAYENYVVPGPTPQFMTPTPFGQRGNAPIDLHTDFDVVVHQNIGCTFTWSSGGSENGAVLYEWAPSYIEQGETTYSRFTDWSNGGYPGNKYLQGVRIKGGWQRAQPIDDQVSVKVESDLLDSTSSTGHAGATIALASLPDFGVFAGSINPPLTGHLFRVLPNIGVPEGDRGTWRVLEVEYIFEPMPDGVQAWASQWTTHNAQGYQHLRDAEIAYAATAEVQLIVNMDNGASDSYTLPATIPSAPWQANTAYLSGQFIIDPSGHRQNIVIPGTSDSSEPPWDDSGGQTVDGTVVWEDAGAVPPPLVKYYLQFQANKSKLYQYVFSTTTDAGLLYLFRDYCEVRYKQWGSQGNYEVAKPFGDQSLEFGGARI